MATTKSGLKNTALFGPALQMMFVVAAGRLQMPLEEFYLFLILILGLQAILYYIDTGEKVIDTREYEVRNLLPQGLTGAAFALLIGAPLIIWGRLMMPAPGTFGGELTTQGLFVSFVETVFLVVTVRTLKIGNLNVGWIAWPFLFAFMHPVVRDNWMRGEYPMESFTGFLFAALFGVLFWLLMEGARLAPRRYRILFGPVTSWSCHFIINLIILLFSLTVLEFTLTPLMLGLLVLPVGLVVRAVRSRETPGVKA